MGNRSIRFYGAEIPASINAPHDADTRGAGSHACRFQRVSVPTRFGSNAFRAGFVVVIPFEKTTQRPQS